MKLTIEILGANRATKQTLEMGRRMRDIGGDAPALASIMLHSADLNFEYQGRPPWVGLSEPTIKRRRNKDKASIQILLDSGILRASLSPGSGEMTSIHDGATRYSIREATRNSVHVGTNRPGASNHQTGATVPQRKFLAIQDEDVVDMKTTLTDYYLGRANFAMEIL